MKLHDIEPCCGQRLADHGVVGIDEQPDQLRAPGGALPSIAASRKARWRGEGEEHQAGIVGTLFEHGVERLGAVDPADLDGRGWHDPPACDGKLTVAQARRSSTRSW
jgi:hypothetical protein